MDNKKQYITYDTSKNMKCEINPAFITGLQQIYGRYISAIYETPENMGNLIKDFNETVMDPEAAKKKGREFTPVESEIYTLYSLIHIMKGYAKEQKLEIFNDLDVTEEQFGSIVKEVSEEEKDPLKMLTLLAEKLGQESS